ncbi:MAG TPA: DUF1798 family protein [Virgibacillus sp.]|nr:DUF1798 family protein [Virgibacillus sp.]
MSQQLIDQTYKLKDELDRLKDYYLTHEPPESKNDKPFFMMVKETLEPIYQALEKWEEDALHSAKQRQTNVHPQQITSTKENMDMLLLHSYYIDVKRKRYMEMNHSIHYVFDQLLRDLT